MYHCILFCSSLVLGSNSSSTDTENPNEIQTEHDKRSVLQQRADPVYTVSLPTFTMESLNTLQNSLGAETFGKLMDTVDFEIVEQLKQFMR